MRIGKLSLAGGHLPNARQSKVFYQVMSWHSGDPNKAHREGDRSIRKSLEDGEESSVKGLRKINSMEVRGSPFRAHQGSSGGTRGGRGTLGKSEPQKTWAAKQVREAMDGNGGATWVDHVQILRVNGTRKPFVMWGASGGRWQDGTCRGKKKSRWGWTGGGMGNSLHKLGRGKS